MRDLRPQVVRHKFLGVFALRLWAPDLDKTSDIWPHSYRECKTWNMRAVCKFLLRQFLPGSEVDGSVGVGSIRIRQRTCFIESVMYWGYFGGLNFNFPRLRKFNQLLPVHPEPWWSYAIFWSCTTWNWSTLQMWGMRPQVREEQVFVTSFLVCFISDSEVLIVINWEIHGGPIVTGNARLSWNFWLSQDAAGTFFTKLYVQWVVKRGLTLRRTLCICNLQMGCAVAHRVCGLRLCGHRRRFSCGMSLAAEAAAAVQVWHCKILSRLPQLTSAQPQTVGLSNQMIFDIEVNTLFWGNQMAGWVFLCIQRGDFSRGKVLTADIYIYKAGPLISTVMIFSFW